MYSELVIVRDAAHWRAWLAEHHDVLGAGYGSVLANEEDGPP